MNTTFHEMRSPGEEGWVDIKDGDQVVIYTNDQTTSIAERNDGVAAYRNGGLVRITVTSSSALTAAAIAFFGVPGPLEVATVAISGRL